MSKPIFTSHSAERQILEIDAWWRANREKAPNRFEDELALAFETLATLPRAGQRYPHPSMEIRRVLLRSTKHHVYYVEQEDRILVVAVWGAIKGAGPELSGI